MAAGLKVYDEDANVLVDVDSRLTRHRYGTTADSGVSDSAVVSSIDGKTTIQFAIPTTTNTDADAFDFAGGGGGATILVPHEVTRDGTTIAWTEQSPGTKFVSADSVIVVFSYDD